MREPGRALLRIVDALGMTRLRDGVLVPAIADMRHECAKAGSRGRSLFVMVRGYWSIVMGSAFYAALLPARHIRENWSGHDAAGPRLVRNAFPVALVVVALCYGYLGIMAATSSAQEWRLPPGMLRLFLTSGIVMALPPALAMGIGWVLARDRSGSRAAVTLGLLGTMFSFGFIDFAVTREVHAYRLSSASLPNTGRLQFPKDSEMTFGELTRAQFGPDAEPRGRCSCARNESLILRAAWQRRLSMPALVFSFAVLAVALSRTGRRLIVVAGTWAAYVGAIWILATSALRDHLPVALAAWGAHLVPLTLAAVLHVAMTRRTSRTPVTTA